MRDSTGLGIDNPRFDQPEPEMGDQQLPRVMRYVSSLEDFEGEPCFGLVVEAEEGVPISVLNLTAIDADLGSTFADFLEHDGFGRADEFADPEILDKDEISQWIEVLDTESLATTVLPPIDLTLDQLQESGRVVIAIGLNYRDQREERGAGSEDLVFLKQAAPTGAYAPLSLGPAVPPFEGSRDLVDYEAEIGFVLLEDIYLDELPGDLEALRQTIAFFAANDVTDRLPMILEGYAGASQAKSLPGYLPVGPWMIHGRHLDLRSRASGMETVDLWLRIEEPEPMQVGSWRQYASSSQMIRGPLEILRLVAKEWSRASSDEASGDLISIATVVEGRPVLRAGSVVLTGTPGGTAIESPSGMDRLRLMALGNLSMRGAKLAFAKHCVRHRREMGFLSVGDRVETRIQHLGRQLWTVVP